MHDAGDGIWNELEVLARSGVPYCTKNALDEARLRLIDALESVDISVGKGDVCNATRLARRRGLLANLDVLVAIRARNFATYGKGRPVALDGDSVVKYIKYFENACDELCRVRSSGRPPRAPAKLAAWGLVSPNLSILPPKPPPPFDARFAREDRLPLVPTSMLEERELRRAIRALTPEALAETGVRIVEDLRAERTSIHCPVTPNDETGLVWASLIRQWWDSLGEELRVRFVRSAREFREREREPERVVARNVGYRRLFRNITYLKPLRLYEAFDAISCGREPFCPDGFPDGACDEWRRFLRHEWFEGLSPEQRRRLTHVTSRLRDVPQEMAAVEEELAGVRNRLSERGGLMQTVVAWLSSAKREQRSTDEQRCEMLLKKLEALRAESALLDSPAFVAEESARSDSLFSRRTEGAPLQPRHR